MELATSGSEGINLSHSGTPLSYRKSMQKKPNRQKVVATSTRVNPNFAEICELVTVQMVRIFLRYIILTHYKNRIICRIVFFYDHGNRPFFLSTDSFYLQY